MWTMEVILVGNVSVNTFKPCASDIISIHCVDELRTRRLKFRVYSLTSRFIVCTNKPQRMCKHVYIYK